VIILQKPAYQHDTAAKAAELGQHHQNMLNGVFLASMTKLENQCGIRLVAKLGAESGEHIDPVLAAIKGIEQAGEDHTTQLQLAPARLPWIALDSPAIQPGAPCIRHATRQYLLIPSHQILQGDSRGTFGGAAEALIMINWNLAAGFGHGPDDVLFSRQRASRTWVVGGR